ncbi:MAG TPA: GTPase Era [Alphaproteobacteria bacterium]|nr:GTPase Era [Alphaproteobacteria bacterium]
MIDNSSPKRCGFVAIVGAPNAGKSTLMNHLLGIKLAAVSAKAQTTRSRIRGVLTEGQGQIIFVDTPGIFKPEKKLDRAMVRAAWHEEQDADIRLLIMDASRGKIYPHTLPIIETIKEQKIDKTWLLLNKIDKVDRQKLLPLAQECQDLGIFENIMMIAAKHDDGLEDLKNKLLTAIPEGEWHYPEDHLTDLSERLIAAELTREQLYHQLGAELPYASTVVTDSWEVFRNGSVKVSQTILIERESQKPIVLGKGGQKIRDIREAAQTEIAELAGCPVHLFLYVKVAERWKDDPEHYENWGLEYKA